MIFSDIYEDARQVLGYAEESVVMSRVSDAVEVLNNKGNFDALLGYLITTPTGDIITLPPDVEVPLRVNVDDNPAFPRDKFWVFSQNGPGSNAALAEWNWVDKGWTSVATQPTASTALAVVGDVADNGKTVTVTGRTSAGILATPIIYTIGSAASTRQLKTILRVQKDITTQSVTLQTSGAVILSVYAAGETEPNYRQIRINKSGGTAYILFRSKTFRVAAQTNYIPIRSKMGLLYMIKALEAYRREQPDLGQQLETMALKLATEEQGSNNAFVELSNQIDAPPCRGLSYARRDILTVADIYDDACMIFGPIGYHKIFDRITETFQLLANKGNFDSMLSYLRVSSASTLVTLPNIVEVPIKVSIDGNPAFARDRIYEFSMNGPGPDAERVNWQWEDRGSSPVAAQPPAPQRLKILGNVADNGATVRIKGEDANGSSLDETVTLGATISTAAVYAHVTQVIKSVTTNTLDLKTFDGVNLLSTYNPEETVPQYRQIRLSKASTNVYILYRQKSPVVQDIADILPLRSKMALILMMKANAAYRMDKIEEAKALEAEATKKITEEQASYSAFSIAARDESPPCRGFSYARRDILIVADIYDDACSIFGPIGIDKIFDRVTETFQALANKGNMDSMMSYLRISTTKTLITLPLVVETPIKIAIDGNPAFARNRFFEFTMNGPGPDAERVGWQWEDKGAAPVVNQPSSPSALQIIGNVSDNGAQVSLTGYDSTGVHLTEVLTLGATQIGAKIFAHIDSVRKPVTLQSLELLTADGSEVLSIYHDYQTIPQYRQIRISKAGNNVYILYRQKSPTITSIDDILPLRSKMAFVLMMKAVKAYRDGDVKAAKEMETEAAEKVRDEQSSYNAFAALADEGTALNLSYNNIDSIIVADIYDDACRIFGPIGREHIYDKITEAKSILGRKCQWDSLRGYVDINTDQYKYVTLPRYVEYPIAISINNRGGRMQNKWFAFHLDGPDSCWTTLRCNSWRELGEFVTLRDVPYSIKLSAVPDLPDVDDGKEIIVYGYFRGKRLQRQDENGRNIDGIAIPIDSTTTDYSEVNFDRIERISKPVTNGFVKLLAADTTLDRKFTIGYYYPDETEPRYRRIELPCGCEVIRMMYRVRENKVSSLTDPIHLRSKMAIVCMMQAMKLLAAGDVKNAEPMEQKAIQYLMDEQAINNQSDGLTIDVDPNFSLARHFLPS